MTKVQPVCALILSYMTRFGDCIHQYYSLLCAQPVSCGHRLTCRLHQREVERPAAWNVQSTLTNSWATGCTSRVALTRASTMAHCRCTNSSVNYTGFALEPNNLPDAIRHVRRASWPSIVLRPDQTYQNYTSSTCWSLLLAKS